MTAFDLARRLRAGETIFSAWCNLGSPIVAEVIAREGFACVVLEQQHGLWDTAAIVTGIGAVHLAGSTPAMRISLTDFTFVSRALDMGAEAIVAPMINTAADARQFVSAAKYPPLGERSWGPQRAMTLQGKTVAVDYLREANDGTLTLAMIETKDALANVDAIAGTPGIDALFIGPYDLAIALSGGNAQNIFASQVERAVDEICQAAKKAGKIPGIYCRDPARALAMAKRGFRFLAVGSDHGIIREGAAALMKALKS